MLFFVILRRISKKGGLFMEKHENKKRICQAIINQAIIESDHDLNLQVDVTIEDVIYAAVGACILMSETSGQNTLRDLYRIRRMVTAIIKRYKEGLPWTN